MTVITQVLDINNDRRDYILGDGDDIVDGSKYIALPGLIDPHVHFRVPGMPHKEDWITGARAAFAGGYTTVFDMPNTIPATVTVERLEQKQSIIDQQISQSNLPLKYKLFFGASSQYFDQIHLAKDHVVGIKVFMGSSTGDLLMRDIASLHAIYALAKRFDLIIALHAEDDTVIENNMQQFAQQLSGRDFALHSKIRSPAAACSAIETVIELSCLYGVKSYILHVSSIAELDLIRRAKYQGIAIYAETCPHYLFLDDTCYTQAGLVKMNPPLRSIDDQHALWVALLDGTIDTVGSDHAPHTLQEKDQCLGKCPSGVPGIETTLPLMLTAFKHGRISLSKIIELLYGNPKSIFGINTVDDMVFVNIEDYHEVQNICLRTKVQWSPFAGMLLTGWPEYVYSGGILIKVADL